MLLGVTVYLPILALSYVTHGMNGYIYSIVALIDLQGRLSRCTRSLSQDDNSIH